MLMCLFAALEGRSCEARGAPVEDGRGPESRTDDQPRGSALDRPWTDEIVYVVIVGKFCNGDPTNDVMRERFGKDRSRYEGGFWGGDLQGIIDQLDYLESLGVTTLLLYPVVDNDDGLFGKYLATGYRPKDYYKIDENFGDIATLRRLVESAHRRSMRVLLDLPLSLPGTEHPIYRDPDRKDWFGKGSPYGVRQWNAENIAVADYLIAVSKFWKRESGCDGFRLDSAHLHSTAFWKQYAAELKGEGANDGFVLWAEVPLHPRRIGEFLVETGFDTAYDFSFGIVRDVFGRGDSLGKLTFVAREAKQFYTHPRRMVAQIDNYEDPTFLAHALEPKQPRTELALTLLLTTDRVPVLYTGDEAALDYRATGALFAAGVPASPALERTRKLIALRKREPALREGDFTEVGQPGPVFAFLRNKADRRVLIVLNASDAARNVEFTIGDQPWSEAQLHDLLEERVVKPRGGAGLITVEPFGARVLRVD
ncbi:MAG: alpha-amylase family glycosyl hydrolase [Planctomycetaceae bacterium]